MTRGTIVRAPWVFGALPIVVASVPVDSAYCDFWSDEAGGWHVFEQREEDEVHGRYGPATMVGARWDLSRSSGKWQIAVVDSEAGGHDGECAATPKLEQGAAPAKSVGVHALLDGMLILDRGTPIPREPDALEDSDDWLWVPSALDSTFGLEMGGGTGDTYHAMEPVVWVSRKTGQRTKVYNEGASGGQSGHQIAFAERDGRMLIVSEYEGGYPSVVDMRTGRVVFRVNKMSARAVWVPPPR